mgnify:FL=1
MKFTSLTIRHFKSIEEMKIRDIENALILVGKNNTGKTSVLDAIRMVTGSRQVRPEDFNEKLQNIEIEVELEITGEDLSLFHQRGAVSSYKRYSLWEQEVRKRLPSFRGEKLNFTCAINREGKRRYGDGFKKHNKYIEEIIPRLYYIDTDRNMEQLQRDLLLAQTKVIRQEMREDSCMFDGAKTCRHCFQCIGLINQKRPKDLTLIEAARLMEYKMYQMNLNRFAGSLNENFHKNGGLEEISYSFQWDPEQVFGVRAQIYDQERGRTSPIETMSRGMKSIYMLSLLETYNEEEDRMPSIVVVEYPEMFLHPQLQKVASEILYRLSKKNQVIFSTHSPNLIFNFNSRQIRQVVLDGNFCSAIREKTDIGSILDDLGYGAADLMNVSFVFFVEGKQDKSRLPLLLEKYYSEILDEEGRPSRISIITTNSCTNIKTYANLKYMNQLYIRDQFLMIRDGDGKDPKELKRQLCRYYDERNLEDVDRLPRVRPEHVLVLRYYSFENYFLNPEVMAKLGILSGEEEFYDILWEKWQEYLHRLKSGKKLAQVLGRQPESREDLKAHMEEVKTYVRGHNLFDLFYGPYKKEEKALLKAYIDLAPREDFQDILDAIDQFVYFDSRKKAR